MSGIAANLCRRVVTPFAMARATTLFCLPSERRSLRALAAESAHGVTGVASLILLPDIGDQRLRALYFDFQRGDKCIFGVNDDVSRFALNFKADRKLHRYLPLSIITNIAQFSCEVELLAIIRFSVRDDIVCPFCSGFKR
jgi:hypothetical protein